jgi:hypothetical protein
MQDKHKVTLYLPQEVHHKLKIRSAVDLEAMSAIAERAIVFYLENSEVVDEIESAHGQVHQVYSCPNCTSALVLRDGEMTSLREQVATLLDDETATVRVQEICAETNQIGEGELITCQS